MSSEAAWARGQGARLEEGRLTLDAALQQARRDGDLPLIEELRRRANGRPSYVIRAASASGRGLFGSYRRVAVLELEDGFAGEPAMISERARGVSRLIWDSGPCNVGKTERGAYQVALREAEALAAKFNAGEVS